MERIGKDIEAKLIKYARLSGNKLGKQTLLARCFIFGPDETPSAEKVAERVNLVVDAFVKAEREKIASN